VRLFAAIVPPSSALADLDDCVRPLRPAWPGLRWTGTDAWHVTLAFFGEVSEGTVADLSARLERAARRHPAQSLAIQGVGAFPKAARANVLWAGIRSGQAGQAGSRGGEAGSRNGQAGQAASSGSQAGSRGGEAGSRSGQAGQARGPSGQAGRGGLATGRGGQAGQAGSRGGQAGQAGSRGGQAGLARGRGGQAGQAGSRGGQVGLAGLAGLAASVAAAGRRAGAPPPDEGRPYRPHLTLARCRVPVDVRPLLEALDGIAGAEWSASSIHLISSHQEAGRPRYADVASWPLRS
jgi:2'-5' RNA ligase